VKIPNSSSCFYSKRIPINKRSHFRQPWNAYKPPLIPYFKLVDLKGFLEWFAGLFGKRKEKCEKTVRYDGKTIKFSGLDVPALKFKLGEIQIDDKKLREASEGAAILDDFQFNMCKICNNVGRDDPDWRNYNRLRVSALLIITEFRLAFEAVKANPAGKEKMLDDIMAKFRRLDPILDNVLPKRIIQSLRPKRAIPIKQLPPVDKKSVTMALRIAKLQKGEVDKVLDKVI
jgi:hypothetical protein